MKITKAPLLFLPMLEDKRGIRIGRLVLDTELPADKKRRRRWLCKCDCGGEIIINSAQLRRGYPDNCGCQKPIMRSDLRGKRFGKLEVIAPSSKRGTRGARTVPLWECRCDCGNICYKATDTLTNPDENMCAECADKVHTAKARANAGFVGGTQISKIRSDKLSKANTSGV